ncbi:uncharacterized protein SPPG_03213 [Spizellomyces punctatus DAOM BR117]|uniref:Cilia- and flagella-associated protein 263 n=1 Tax=Spizellomyces punctatus (strain DAOM BR117) TaxID=645134 RepID=A0A0L0HK43_SPIPD|nr:uncharacterized protein SPPG_03213 [Spizellomyces punctatus DAOM BR117]KND01403.1 hypothetical protein SPPG_03213 [Spizellomyces punctatus DAOM BR117]|eukprot:XP_016609442.1 hypothetical protein SPPG_03213 [Spizellomyces punctatus DAOM BR117]
MLAMDDVSPSTIVRERSIPGPIPASAHGPPLSTTGGTALPMLEDTDFDSYSDAELAKLYEELVKKAQFLEAENTLFESFLNRVGPDVASGASAGAGGAKGTAGGEMGYMDLEGPSDFGGLAPGTSGLPAATPAAGRARKKKGEKVEKHQAPILLTPEQKSEIATRELEELKDEIERQKEEWGKVLDNYKAEMEEIDIRISETKKAMYEFKRDIVQGAVNPRTNKVVAERVLRYFEDKIRGKDAIIKKTRLKNSTIKLQKNKLHLQLKQKEEMGEVLHAIDFDQLQIENKQYLAKIEERNAELLKLKMTAGNTQQVLNFHKRKLQALTQESDFLKQEIAQRQEVLTKLLDEAEVVEQERAQAQRTNQKIKEQIEEFRVPDVMDYVSIKAQQEDLKSKLKTWERKVGIATMQTQRLKKIWRQMCLHAHPHPAHQQQNRYYIDHNRLANVPQLPPVPI